jgi:hypothetical protein
MVGFNKDDLKDMYKSRVDEDGFVFFLPEDVIENTIKAFSTNPTSPTGYGALGPPEGRYFAPASGPIAGGGYCLETIEEDYGDCGERNIQIDGPWTKNLDVSVVKVVPIKGRLRAEFRVEMLNAFNWVNFSPVTGIGSTNKDGFDTTGLNAAGSVNARIIQLVTRVSW